MFFRHCVFGRLFFCNVGKNVELYQNSSSWRVCSLEETLANIQPLAKHVGITRVTDTTRLDKIGIPVYASIRPNAAKGSLCVNAGKGLQPLEAKVGAFMEAFEFSFSEFKEGRIKTYKSTPRRIVSQKNVNFDFVDLCPIWNVEVEPDSSFMTVQAEDIATGDVIEVPAELAFSPFGNACGQMLFGSSTNGLCSGNSIIEATLHGICEVLERDVQAFNYMKNKSRLVNEKDLPHNVSELIDKIKNAGFDCYLRYTDNLFGLPYFQGYIAEKNFVPIAISHGTGLHLSSSIAAVRALTEAAQSRLSYIHGGRDDLIDRHKFFLTKPPEYEQKEIERMRESISDQENLISFAEIPDYINVSKDIHSVISFILNKLQRLNFNQVLRVELTPKSSELKVVKVIIPKIESFNPKLKRMGPRLAEHIENIN